MKRLSPIPGFLPPTSGTAYINGLDINKDIDAIRRAIGLCPQHNILFDNLTVKEHLVFFSSVRMLQEIFRSHIPSIT